MISGIPAPTGSLVQRSVFYGTSATEGANWQTYSIPPNISMLYIFLWGAGGSGGSGFAGNEDEAGGGGGGGSGGQTRVLLPSAFLPSTLYLSVGLGGVVGSGSGAASRISVYPDLTANHCVARAGAGNNGGTGSNTVAGGGGAGGAVADASAANMPLGYMGLVSVVAGVNGTTGGRNAATPTGTVTTTTTNNGGTGGGGVGRTDDTARNGGTRPTTDNALFFPVQPAGLGTATPINGIGSHGFFVNKNLLYTYGGTGGRSGGASGANGSNGGAGGYGSGGGGGGASFTGDVAGIGGRGGDGLAIIYAW